MTQLSTKLVAVVNKNLDPGKAMNTLSHMSIAMGATIGTEELQLVDYVDADQNIYPSISKMPFIILRANSNKIKHLHEHADIQGIKHITFTNAMTVGSWEEQLERSLNTARDDLEFYGIVLFGEFETVNNMTKKFSLWQ